MIQRALVVLVLSILFAALAGCGTSCKEIRDERAAFDVRERWTRGPDARIGLPFGLIDRVIAGQLVRRPPVPIALELDKLGVPLDLQLALERVTTRRDEPGRLGMTLHLGLVDPARNERVLELEIDTAITPDLVTEGPLPALAIVLRPKDLGAARMRTTPDGTRTLARWVRERVPSVARFLPDELVDALAQSALDLLAGELWPRAKDDILGKHPLVDTRFTLPDLPIRDLALSSSASGLDLTLTTDLPEAEPIGGAPDLVGERVLLRMSGGTAMGLVNRAMARGEVPSRFDAAGKPSPEGVWEARVGWRGGSSPLLLHLWRTSGECKRAEVAARLGLQLQGDSVRVAVHDGRLVSVAGPAFAEAFAWIEMVFGKALATTFDTDAFVRFDAGDDVVQLRLARAQLGDSDLVLELDLGVAPRPRVQ